MRQLTKLLRCLYLGSLVTTEQGSVINADNYTFFKILSSLSFNFILFIYLQKVAVCHVLPVTS